MPSHNPADIAAKWQQNLVASVSNGYFSQGVDRFAQANPTNGPGQRAAARADHWMNQVTKSKAKWAQNVGAVTTAQWATALKTYGGERISALAGRQDVTQDMTTFYTSLMKYITENPDAAAQLPPRDGTIGTAQRRASLWISYMAGFTPPAKSQIRVPGI